MAFIFVIVLIAAGWMPWNNTSVVVTKSFQVEEEVFWA
jgi:hypothetical protein